MYRIKSNIHPSRRRFLGGTISAAVAASLTGRADAADRDAGEMFANVPNASRMRMHWYIFGPAWTAPEARRQMELMARANIGGVLIFPTYPIAEDDPSRGIKNEKYLSPQFLSVLNSVVADAKRLGLTVDIVLGTGWPYGGPSVRLEDSVYSLKMTSGPAGAQLAAPSAGEKPVATFLVDGKASQRVEDGAPAAGAHGELQRFFAAPTRMQVKRAGLGAEGFIVDHYRTSSLENFLREVGDKLLDSVPRGSIRSIFCDSFEVYRANWTPEFPAIFQRMRGYDLIPHLPALFNSAHPDSRDLRCDFWRSLSEQATQAFVAPLTRWAHGKGVTTQVEAYGTPPVSLASYRYVDIPVGEHYEWKEFSSSRWASSGGHLAAKPIILVEAWTWLGLPNRFADTLEQLKLCSDLHFLSGINSLYGVTYAYSPIELGSPGWVPYFGPATNHTSPYWLHFPHLADYINRASFVLQQGKPVADVAVYLPSEDAMAEANSEQLLLNWAVRDRLSSNGPPPEFSLKNALHYESDVLKTIITNGYSFDGVDTFTMNDGMRVENGRLRMGDGDYAVLVLPNLSGIDVESLRKIESFVRTGGTVVATKRLPERSYGLRDRENRNREARESVTRLFGPATSRDAYRETRFGNGRAIFCSDELGSFRKALRNQPPDILFLEPSEHVSFVHRRASDRDYYFIANTSANILPLDGVFRMGKKVPEQWDLSTGQIRPLLVFEHVTGGTRVPFELGPFESKVIVFRAGSREPVAHSSDLPIEPGGAKAFRNGSFVLRTGRQQRRIAIDGIPAPYALNLSWKLRLGDRTIQLDGLKSWTEIPESRFFSGQGIYEADFTAPVITGLGVILDLGQVRETAKVQINGQDAGTAWMRPYRLEAGRFLKRGANRIRVEVTNLLINQILGQGPIDYSKVYALHGRRFPAGDEWDVIRDPLPSGLLGPVRLVFYKYMPV